VVVVHDGLAEDAAEAIVLNAGLVDDGAEAIDGAEHRERELARPYRRQMR
jgi:hypothetical protein